MSPSRYKYLFFASLFLSLVLGGLLTHQIILAKNQSVAFQQIRGNNQGTANFTYINPLLECPADEAALAAEFKPLKTKLDAIIKEKIATRSATQVSVYFDTRDGHWLAINTDEKYFPGSLMKVPTVIAYLKLAESQPELLKKKITWDGAEDLGVEQYFKPTENLQTGESYTVEELLQRTIAYSDNNAVQLLLNTIDKQFLLQVYTDLGISIPTSTATTVPDFMPIKNYARIFKILYNASYLSRDLSEKALTLLSQADFAGGIRGGIPANLPLVQKFGEHYQYNEKNATSSPHELHNCGVIYYPQKPYLLCVFTKGDNYQELSETIQNISKAVYDFVDHRAVQP